MSDTDANSIKENIPYETKKEFAKEQLNQAIETFRWQINLLIQMTGGLMAADVAVAGIAFSAKNAGILPIGAVIPFILLVAFLRNYEKNEADCIYGREFGK
jgi:hypothetical protein